ncbi:MAG: dienelactone hydrolase family protein [Anaerolineales bacterium]|nr:dienelactone hydrolase family protein [Anaerolineales bacterium]
MFIQKSEIKLDVNGKSINAYFAAPENGGPGVLVLHAWWGLKPFFKQLCDQLAEHGYVALAPDLHNGQIAETIDTAKELMQNSDNQLIGDTVMAAKEHLHNLTHNNIGVIGFSMGAAWALVVASDDPNNIAATVLFYGANDGVDFNKIKSKVLGHFCKVDEWEPLEGVREMEAKMKAANVDVTLHFYPTVSHWFMESDRPEYDSASAQLAWDRTFEFLKDNLM